MSYEIVKSITHRKKDNKIFITSASNNIWPRTYSKWQYMPDSSYSKEETINKELHFFRGIIGGSYKLSNSVNENWRYAENKFYEYCKEKDISTFDIWELPYKNDGNIESLKPYYDIFRKFLEEKIEGKYYLSSNLGCITKVNRKSYNMCLILALMKNIVKIIKNYIMIYVIYQNKIFKDLILKLRNIA